MRERGVADRLGLASARSGRFRSPRVRAALQHAKRVVVLEKCLAVGLAASSPMACAKSLSGIALKGYTVIAGLGGRAITRASLTQLFEDRPDATNSRHVTFLDLNAES